MQITMAVEARETAGRERKDGRSVIHRRSWTETGQYVQPATQYIDVRSD